MKFILNITDTNTEVNQMYYDIYYKHTVLVKTHDRGPKR